MFKPGDKVKDKLTGEIMVVMECNPSIKTRLFKKAAPVMGLVRCKTSDYAYWARDFYYKDVRDFMLERSVG